MREMDKPKGEGLNWAAAVGRRDIVHDRRDHAGSKRGASWASPGLVAALLCFLRNKTYPKTKP